jgi:hypothetical protein
MRTKMKRQQSDVEKNLDNRLIEYLASKPWVDENYQFCEKCSQSVHRNDCLSYCWACSKTDFPLAKTNVAPKAIEALAKLSFPCYIPGYEPGVTIENMENLQIVTSASKDAVLMPSGSTLLVNRLNNSLKASSSWRELANVLPFRYKGNTPVDEFAPIRISCGTAMQICRSVLDYYCGRQQNFDPCKDIEKVKVERIVYVKDNTYGCHMTYCDGN